MFVSCYELGIYTVLVGGVKIFYCQQASKRKASLNNINRYYS